MVEVKPGEYNGTYMHYGVREHGMAAAMNGIALHGGLISYGGTFLCFSDYCRPSIPSSPDADPDGLRHDARLDRFGRGRPDPSAGRTACRAARGPASRRLPSG